MNIICSSRIALSKLPCAMFMSRQCPLEEDAKVVVKQELEEEEEYSEQRQKCIQMEDGRKVLVAEMKQEGETQVVKKEFDVAPGQPNVGKVADNTTEFSPTQNSELSMI